MTREQTQNAKDIVLPITMLGGLMTLAFFTGSAWTRIAYVETTQVTVVATLRGINETISQMRIDDERMRVQLLGKERASADQKREQPTG